MLLLDKLSQQKTSSRIYSGQIGQNRNQKKIMKFFSGQIQSSTLCRKCKNSSTHSQAFFTYSLTLPQISQIIFNFIYIDQSFTPLKYSFIVNKQLQLGSALQQISSYLKIKKSNLLTYTIFQNQWYHEVGYRYMQRQINSFDNYQLLIVCYKINCNDQPDYNDFRKSIKRTSVKLQVRNRMFDGKKQEGFKSFFLPFCVEVFEDTDGKGLKQKINQKMNKFVDQDELEKYQKAVEEKSDDKNNPTSERFLNTQDMKNSKSKLFNTDKNNLKENKQEQTPGCQKQDDLSPYIIRYVRLQKYSQNICWHCLKQINDGKFHKNSDYCGGCEFNPDQKLYQTKTFRKHWDNLTIMIDWRSKTLTKNFIIEQSSTCEKALNKQNQSKNRIQQLLRQSQNQQQTIQLKCQKPECGSLQAIRKQRIKLAPNILILHLKRFQFRNNKFMKMRNRVQIPQEFILPGTNEKYQLYGNVVHYGSGRGGHYISYVKVKDRWFKCDDEKVYEIKVGGNNNNNINNRNSNNSNSNSSNNNKEYLNQDTYILFYKKKNIQKGLKVFGF